MANALRELTGARKAAILLVSVEQAKAEQQKAAAAAPTAAPAKATP